MAQKRLARVDRELCNPKVSGYACKKSCPINRSGDDCITISPEDKKIFIDESLCIGCGICVKKCPKNAIDVVNLPKELQETPIHRYGRNEFSLYRLPVPKQNAVIGLIGPNGTGKSTILNILSSGLRPNTGSFGVEIPWEEIIDRFKGTELQGYLERLAVQGVKSAYKPQHVDMIPKVWKGKVKALLEKASEVGSIKGVVGRLGIGEMLDKDVSSLSGGELQLLAIGAALLKKADFYFFDEPSSYLDAYERLEVAKVIRELSRESVVMVVEHDLAVADYLADYTHILYGRPGVFGIVSKPYVVRTGINTYLEGYIREENMRFRDQAITFSQRAKPAEKDKTFTVFPGFEKRFKAFSMRTEAGTLHKGEIVGILGPNGTGKTTFIRMLIGEEKPDKGEALSGVVLSYKPQRLILSRGEEGMQVGEYIGKFSGVSLTAKENKRVLAFLGIEPILERDIKNLSGGELQSVMVASRLLKKHDILFLDEPSAFLDVEQRLRVARLLREHAESKEIPVFVVDHDLQFIDVLSDRVIVFEGERGVRGRAGPPTQLEEGMNSFLKSLGVTYRRDPETGRPRANKPDSQKDTEQKRKGKYYYAE
jgi:ATP-binding cassette subfamily E protein 1